MIHGYPAEYYYLYEQFAGGSTIREWVNAVEKLGREILDDSDQMTKLKLGKKLPAGWTFEALGDEYKIQGEKDPKALSLMRTLGASYDVKKKCWYAPKDYIVEQLNKEELYKFKGDMLEVLSEIFFRTFGADEGLGLFDYEPIDLSDDYGVDAKGRNVNGHDSAVQVKYRANPQDLIPYSDIARTFTSATCQLKMMDVLHYDHTIFLFTTAYGVTVAYQKVMGKKSVVVDRNVISTKIDNNKNFWTNAYEMIKATIAG